MGKMKSKKKQVSNSRSGTKKVPRKENIFKKGLGKKKTLCYNKTGQFLNWKEWWQKMYSTDCTFTK
ncbi:MAG TPA: hypothetical protein DDW34_10510, partial [Clostridium sp.]|nr:hypothetical protein [Clostridium sp.]